MERKEPTLSGGATNEREEALVRRTTPVHDEPRANRSPADYAPAAASSGTIPAIALVLGLVGVGGAGFLGFQLMEAKTIIEKDSARIAQLEAQLNVTSTESTQSVTALGINLQKIDGEVKKLWDVTKKSNTDHNEKENSLSKSIDSAKTEINNLKGEISSLKQDSLAHKASIEELPPRIEEVNKNIAEQRKKITDVAAGVNTLAGQVKSAEGLASRITRTEEAIDAIDDNRRVINKDLLQIKQQLGIKD
jgi:chromosome segregation ATPase